MHLLLFALTVPIAPTLRFVPTILVSIALIAMQSSTLSCAAREQWEASRKAAEIAALSHNLKLAESEYIRALNSLPATQINTKIKIQVDLAIVQLGLQKYDRAYLNMQGAVRAAEKLRSERKLDPDVLEAIESLHAETTEKIAVNETRSKRIELLRKFAPISFAVYRLFDLRDAVIQRHAFNTARNYVAANSEDLALEQIGIVFPFLKKGESTEDIRASFAALKAKRGQPEMTKQLKGELRSRKTESAALERIAYGQLWAADYDACEATLKEALKKLGKPSQQSRIDEAHVNLRYGSLHIDRGTPEKALPYLRRSFYLLSKIPSISEAELESVRFKLVDTLRGQHLDKEAAQVIGEKDTYGQFDSWLTDSEKALLSKEKAKKKTNQSRPQR